MRQRLKYEPALNQASHASTFSSSYSRYPVMEVEVEIPGHSVIIIVNLFHFNTYETGPIMLR